MQQNPILAVLKLIVITVFTVFLIQSFIQTQWLEEKVMKTREKVDTLGTNVASLKRKVEETAEAAAESKDAAERTYERVSTLIDIAETGGFSGGTNGGGAPPPPTKPRQPDRPTQVRPRQPTDIGGVKVYPRNPGWTVLCDLSAAHDPAAEIPEDQVDWDAVIEEYLSGEPKSFNYHGADGTVTVESVFWYACDSLAMRKQSDPMQYKPMLAERIEESPDRTQYMIYLRKNVPWHRPPLDLDEYPWLKRQFYVTAQDVKWTIEIMQDPNAASPRRYQWERLKDIEIINDHQLLFTWEQAEFYNRAKVTDIQPYPSHIWSRDPEGKPYSKADMAAAFNDHWSSKIVVGNGPYRFVEWKTGEYVRYERFEDYWGQRATCKEFYYHFISDETARLSRFWDGRLTAILFNADQYRKYILEGDPEKPVRKYENFDRPAPRSWEYVYHIYRRPVYGGFAWNMRRDILKDRRVRRALTLALNRFAVPEKFMHGLGEMLPVGESVLSVYFPKHLEVLPFDLDAAREELAAAGWNDTDGDGLLDKVINGEKRDFRLRLLLSSASSTQRQIAQMYKEDLQHIGVVLEIDLAESARWTTQKNDRDFDGLIIFWYAGFDSDPRQLWESKWADEPNSYNITGYKNPEADQIFTQLLTTWDYPTRIKLMHRWYEMQFEDQPYTWIWSVHSPIVANADWRLPKPRQVPRPYTDRRLAWKWKKRP
ncbi:MAG: ABC transporter substrate-binding protein [Planctomycetota bacterium]|jgi:ABC-type transport system substrate-binding protein/outer membrane murein-binding lipoprotein Lpp